MAQRPKRTVLALFVDKSFRKLKFQILTLGQN